MNILGNKYLGKLCKRGHDWNGTGKSLRYKNRQCVKCMIENGIYWVKTHKENRKLIDKKCYLKHIDNAKERSITYYYSHQKESNERNKRYRETHQVYLKEYQLNRRGIIKKYLKTKRGNDTKFRLNRNIACMINHSLKGHKNGHHWENLVEYTCGELKKHLEKQFTEGMSWENYGEWHIDHIIPISIFNFSSPEHLDFKRCWALKNLQPLWAKENIIKSDKFNKPFQPSLSL